MDDWERSACAGKAGCLVETRVVNSSLFEKKGGLRGFMGEVEKGPKINSVHGDIDRYKFISFLYIQLHYNNVHYNTKNFDYE